MAILGIDEVGRGPWAGPLVVGAVILPEKRSAWIDDLKDSKQLSDKRRHELSDLILAKAPATGLGWVWQYEIDQDGLAAALRLATRRALHTLQANHADVKFSEILIDGTQNFLVDTPLAPRVTTLVKGDDLIKEISAASIIAKVARDDYMVKMSATYPAYGFDQHKGYGTAQHRAALQTHGVTPLHRLSLKPIQKILGLPAPSSSRAPSPTNPHLPAPTSPHTPSLIDSSRSPSPASPHTSPLTTSHPSSPTAAPRFHPSSQNTTTIGHTAETVVANFLETANHKIVARNYKNKICEIDLISTYNDKIYFTEVKYRHDPSHGTGFEAITPTKKRQMAFATQVFLANHPQYRSFQPYLAVAAVSGANFQIQDYLVLDE